MEATVPSAFAAAVAHPSRRAEIDGPRFAGTPERGLGEAAPRPARIRSAARPRPLVLVADDHAHIRELIRVVLRDYSVVEAANGPEALSLTYDLAPDILILDVMLPLLSGLEVLKELRADPEMARLGVIVLTAQPAHRDDALEQGADAYFQKPFDPDELVTVVEEVLSRRR